MAKNRTRTALRPTLVSLGVASCFAAGATLANPTGANVVRGTAAIHQTGNLLQITNSPNAIINWQSFSIGANEITRFLQQSPSSAVLNRVTTQNPSEILGSLQSKLLDGVTTGGRVFLINPNGILFGAGAQIDVGGLVASTLRMSDDDFLAGRMRFGDALGKSVVNDGSIATGAGGSVYLIGSGVTNNGIIRSPQGEVILAAGNSVELVNPGTPNLRVEIAALDHEARNLGQIISDAGRIGIYAGLINNSGTIRADSAVSEGGRIVLKASKNTTLEAGSVASANGQRGGSVTVQSADTTLVSGSVEAKGASGEGGSVQVLGNLVGLVGSATINASGETGGGTVLVGGDFQGKNPDVQNAFRTYFGSDATISANATANGDGGKIIIWSDDATRAYGTITARGGAQSGNGGFVEVSGKWLDFNAVVDTRAPNGISGSLLLDPTSIWIALNQASATAAGMAGTDASANVDTGQGFFTAAGSASDSLLTTGVLNSALARSLFVTVSAFNSTGTGVGNITVVDSVTWNTTATLQLSAAAGIDLRAPLNGPMGMVFLSASNGSITQTPGGAINTSALFVDAFQGNVMLNGADNRVALITGHAAGDFRFRNAQSLLIGTINQAESSGISAGNTIDVMVTSGDLMVMDNVLASSSSTSAAVMLNASRGDLLVQGASTSPILVAADGAMGADVNVVAAGSITVRDALVGAAGETFGSTGTNANLALSAGGSVAVEGSQGLFAVGGAGGLNGGNGGSATLSVAAGSSITINGASASSAGGDATAGSGGGATLTMTGSGINVNSVVSAQGGSGVDVSGLPVAMGGAATVTLNAGAGGITIESPGGLRTPLIDQSPVKTVAAPTFALIGAVAIGGDGTSGGAATLALNAAADINVLNSVAGAAGGSGLTGAGGNAQVMLATGGNINLASNVIANGGMGSMNGTGRIDLFFLNSGDFVVSNQAGVIFDPITGSGFMVNGAPAILNVNLFVNGGGSAFIDPLVAAMNTQADVLADQLKAGETGEDKDKKKLPFCSS